MAQYHVTKYTVGQVVEQLAYEGFKVNKIFSKHISGSMKANVMRQIFAKFISLVASHHQLEATVLYLAQERGASIYP